MFRRCQRLCVRLIKGLPKRSIERKEIGGINAISVDVFAYFLVPRRGFSRIKSKKCLLNGFGNNGAFSNILSIFFPQFQKCSLIFSHQGIINNELNLTARLQSIWRSMERIWLMVLLNYIIVTSPLHGVSKRKVNQSVNCKNQLWQ